MKCQTFRDRWARRDLAHQAEDSELLRHRAECAVCQELAPRLDAMRLHVRDLHAGTEPDAGFSARVLQRIETQPDDVEVLGWAAWRVLPAAMVLLVALLAWGSSVGWAPTSLELMLLQGDRSHIAVELLLSSEEDR